MRPVFVLAALLIAGSSVGCVAVPAAADMVPAELDVRVDSTARMTVRADLGGPGRGIFDDTSLTNQRFAEAVRLTVERFDLFGRGDEELAGPQYVLRIGILDHDVPLVGLDMVVTLTTMWVVEDGSSGRELFRESFTTHGLATFGTAFAGPNRARIATRNAAEANIVCGLESLCARLTADGAALCGALTEVGMRTSTPHRPRDGRSDTAAHSASVKSNEARSSRTSTRRTSDGSSCARRRGTRHSRHAAIALNELAVR